MNSFLVIPNTPVVRRILFLTAVLVYASPLWAQTYVSAWDSDGVPTNLVAPTPISGELLQSINQSLPEGTDVRISHPGYLANDDQLRVSLTDSADIYVTFVHEGAGFMNTFGCFLYDTGSPPTGTEGIAKEVLFPNTSYTGSGGGLNTGDTVHAGRHGPGTTMGFWMAANAWKPELADYRDARWNHWSIRDLNLEVEDDLRPHMVLLSDDGNRLILGFEDVLRSESWCDQDFNDMVFMVRANPPEALVLAEVTELPGSQDSDGDGVQDFEDAFPHDPHRAWVQYSPGVSSSEIIAFEDQWPLIGDYDFNDLVLRYQFRESLSSEGGIKEIRAYLDLLARGADYPSGFAIQLEVAASEVDTMQAFHDGVEVDASAVLESGDGDRMVLHMITDAHELLPSPVGTQFTNTVEGTNLVVAPQVEVRVVFSEPVTRDQIGLPPYNPFLYRTNSRGHEIHLLNHPPSDQALAVYFGTGDDESDSEAGLFYRDSMGFPWALILPGDWTHPLETIEISEAYTRFDEWVESGGAVYSDWTSVDRNMSLMWMW